MSAFHAAAVQESAKKRGYLIRSNPLTGQRLDAHQDSRVADSIIPSQVDAVMTELLGSSARPLLDSVDAYQRHVTADDPDFVRSTLRKATNDPGSLADAGEAALRNFAAPYDDRFPVLYGSDMSQKILVANADHKLVKRKMDGLEEITSKYNLDVFNPEGATKSPARTPNLPTYTPPQELLGTALGDVLGVASRTANQYRLFYGQFIQDKFRELEDVRANVLMVSNPALKRDRENEIVREIRQYQRDAVEFLQVQEEDVEELVTEKYGVEGFEFRFDDFDPEELLEIRATAVSPTL